VDTTTLTGTFGNATVLCNGGERATGGGVELILGGPVNMYYYQPGGVPLAFAQGATPTGWRSSWFNDSGGSNTIRVYAVCAAP